MTPDELGQLLLKRRKRLGLTRAYVADLAAISSRQLLEWEAGRGNPGLVPLQAVLTTLGLKMELVPAL